LLADGGVNVPTLPKERQQRHVHTIARRRRRLAEGSGLIYPAAGSGLVERLEFVGIHRHRQSNWGEVSRSAFVQVKDV
jgi:hypothetical protein